MEMHHLAEKAGLGAWGHGSMGAWGHGGASAASLAPTKGHVPVERRTRDVDGAHFGTHASVCRDRRCPRGWWLRHTLECDESTELDQFVRL